MNANQKKIIENYVLAYNAFDINTMTQNMHEDVIFENVSNGVIDRTTKGIEEFQVQAKSAKDIFSNRNQTILDWDFQTDHVSIKILFEGELAIDLPAGASKGDILELHGTSEFQFEDEKIIKLTDKS